MPQQAYFLPPNNGRCCGTQEEVTGLSASSFQGFFTVSQ